MLGFYMKSIIMMCMFSICVIGKKMYKLFGCITKKQEYGQPCRYNDMKSTLQQTDRNCIKDTDIEIKRLLLTSAR